METFLKFYNDVNNFNNYYSTEKVYDHIKFNNFLQDLSKSLIPVLKLKPEFIKEFQGELVQIHILLVGKVAKYYFNNTTINQIRRIHDKLFNYINIRNPKTFYLYLPTQYFHEFIKGITYFQNEKSDDVPLYHREISCGSKALTLKEKYQLFTTNNDNIIKTKKSYVRKCYIERLIYDKIYSHLFFEQDIGHLHELKDTSRLYQDYFPNENINININFVRTKPSKLKIYIDTNMKLTIQYYIKIENIVHCIKVDNNKKIFDKIQSFEQETPWMQSKITSLQEVLDEQNIQKFI